MTMKKFVENSATKNIMSFVVNINDSNRDAIEKFITHSLPNTKNFKIIRLVADVECKKEKGHKP